MALLPLALQAKPTSRAVPCVTDSSGQNRGVAALVDAPGPVMLRLIHVKGRRDVGKAPGKPIILNIDSEDVFVNVEGTGHITGLCGLSLIFHP